MLSNNDLKNIEELFDRKFEQKFEEKFEQKFEEKFEQKFEEKFEQKFAPIKKDIRKIKTDVAKTRKDINMVIQVFDTDNMKLRQRVEVIEDKVGIRR